MKCETCGKEHDGSYGSGRFCCRSCANTRKLSNKTKIKISNSLKKNIISKKEQKQLLLLELLSKGYVYLKYNNINFGKKYIINTNGDIISTYTMKKLNHNISGNNYKRVILSDINNHTYGLLVHRLVATMFIPNPNNYPIINHKDENPSNNNVDNLEWCTYQYNNTYNGINKKRGKSLSKSILEHGSPRKGIHLSEETKQKISNSRKKTYN